jgi:hypothetical protein
MLPKDERRRVRNPDFSLSLSFQMTEPNKKWVSMGLLGSIICKF